MGTGLTSIGAGVASHPSLVGVFASSPPVSSPNPKSSGPLREMSSSSWGYRWGHCLLRVFQPRVGVYPSCGNPTLMDGSIRDPGARRTLARARLAGVSFPSRRTRATVYRRSGDGINRKVDISGIFCFPPSSWCFHAATAMVAAKRALQTLRESAKSHRAEQERLVPSANLDLMFRRAGVNMDGSGNLREENAEQVLRDWLALNSLRATAAASWYTTLLHLAPGPQTGPVPLRQDVEDAKGCDFQNEFLFTPKVLFSELMFMYGSRISDVLL